MYTFPWLVPGPSSSYLIMSEASSSMLRRGKERIGEELRRYKSSEATRLLVIQFYISINHTCKQTTVNQKSIESGVRSPVNGVFLLLLFPHSRVQNEHENQNCKWGWRRWRRWLWWWWLWWWREVGKND